MVTTIDTGLTVKTETRRNLSTNPRALNTAGWISNNGVSWPVTRGVTPPVPHPLGIATSAEARNSGTGGGSDIASLYNVDGLGNTGTPERMIGIWVLVTEPGYRVRAAAGVLTGELPVNTWTWVQSLVPIAAGAFSVLYVTKITGSASTTARAYLTGSMAAAGIGPVGNYFDGGTPPAGDYTYAWLGAVNASASVERLTSPILVVPELVDGYEAAREVRNVVHPVLNRSNPDVALRQPGLRAGRFRCLFPAQEDALDAYARLSVPQVFTIADPDVEAVDMSFVVGPEGESLTIGLDDATRSVWWVTVPFVEVTP